MSWFSDLFGKNKNPDDYKLEKITIPQLTDYPTGKTLNDRILAALNQGQNIGYPEEYINRSTSPFIASRQASWTESEEPYLKGLYGSAGRANSTYALRDIGKAYAQKERDINEIMANAYMQNLQQGKTDTARYENLADAFARGQANIGMAQANLDTNRNIGDLNTRIAIEDSNEQILPRAIGTGLSVASTLSSMYGQNQLLELLRQESNSRMNRPYTTAYNLAG